MDDTLMDSYLDKIAEQVIEEDKIVTYKSLGKSLGIHVNTAKQLLYTYLTNQRLKDSFRISATYLLAGKVIDGSFNITIVSEENLKNAHSNFIAVTSEHVYSIQKSKTLKDLKLLYGINKESTSVESTDLVIKCCKSVLKTKKGIKKMPGSFEEKNKNVTKQVFLAEKQAVSPAEVNTTIETPLVKKSPLESPDKPSPKRNSEKGQKNVKKSEKGSITNMFAKAAQKNSNKFIVEKSNKIFSKNEPEEVDMDVNKLIDVKTVNEDKAKEVVLEMIERRNTTKKSESQGSLKRKKKGIKRKRIEIPSDSEESESIDEEEKIDMKEDGETPLCIINLEEDKEEIKESFLWNKKKKRKLIDTTVMNEDGYLETKKEVVFETDSENEAEEAATPSEKEQKSKSELADNKGKTAKKQSSLLTFFKKS